MNTHKKQPRNTPNYHDINKKIERMCKNAKEDWLNKKYERIEHLTTNHREKEMYQEINKIQQPVGA